MTQTIVQPAPASLVGRIPVRNIWLLFLYAADLTRIQDDWARSALVEDDADLADLIARLLAHAVEHRLHRGLSRGPRPRAAILNRVRGRIDLLRTETGRLLDQGRVACRFRELTLDTPRNRLVRQALATMAVAVQDRALARRCRSLGAELGRNGVSPRPPSDVELARDVIGRNDSEDRLMVALARLALDLALPDETVGDTPLPFARRDAVAARKLFERAVGGFYSTELGPASGWTIACGRRLDWSLDAVTAGAEALLPGMQTDIVLDHRALGRRLVIDTKFTEVLTRGWHRDETVRSAYLYQIYAYLRSQADSDDSLARRAEGLLLHPAVGQTIDEAVVIQGHRIRFATVDLAGSAQSIRDRLRDLILAPGPQEKSPTRAPG